jgi:hypothetical protein
MKYRILLLFMAVIVLLGSGCSSQNISAGPKREVEEYTEKTIPMTGLPSLNISIDSGNLEIYSWEKKEVKLEITKRVRGLQTEELLKKKLGDFNIDIKEDEGKISFKSVYKGSIKNPVDRSTNLRVYVPRKTGSVDCSLKVGKIKFYDDIKCDLSFKIDRANVDINRLVGKLTLKADMCDLKISGGKMFGDSSVKINMGNIYVKSEFEDEGIYTFDTGMGSLEVNLPDGSPVTFECVGSLEVNEFSKTGYPSKVSLRSGMGKIAVRKY